jgi:hypothetical protein
MILRLLIIFSLFFLSSCGIFNRIPTSQNDACELLGENRSWKRAVNATHKKWGVRPSLQLAFIKTESNFRSRAKTPRKFFLGIIPTGRISSAYGYAQALDGTWDWYIKDTGNRSARRSNFADSTDFIGWYVNQTYQKLKIKKYNVYDQYLAYHQGHAGYASGRYKSSEALKAVARKTSNTAKSFKNQLKNCE